MQILITPQAKPKAIAALIALVNLCVEVDFWLEHRMILWDRQRAGELLADILTEQNPPQATPLPVAVVRRVSRVFNPPIGAKLAWGAETLDKRREM